MGNLGNPHIKEACSCVTYVFNINNVMHEFILTGIRKLSYDVTHWYNDHHLFHMKPITDLINELILNTNEVICHLISYFSVSSENIFGILRRNMGPSQRQCRVFSVL